MCLSVGMDPTNDHIRLLPSASSGGEPIVHSLVQVTLGPRECPLRYRMIRFWQMHVKSRPFKRLRLATP
jgi:hypothetical protein